MILLSAALAAPLVGVLRRWPCRLHAITLDGVIDGWERGVFRSACGLRGLRLCAAFDDHAVRYLGAPWPPRLRGMPDGFIRCRVCWQETGKKRPRCEFKART